MALFLRRTGHLVSTWLHWIPLILERPAIHPSQGHLFWYPHIPEPQSLRSTTIWLLMEWLIHRHQLHSAVFTQGTYFIANEERAQPEEPLVRLHTCNPKVKSLIDHKKADQRPAQMQHAMGMPCIARITNLYMSPRTQREEWLQLSSLPVIDCEVLYFPFLKLWALRHWKYSSPKQAHSC